MIAPNDFASALPTLTFVYRYAGPTDHGFQFVNQQATSVLELSPAALIADAGKLVPHAHDAEAFEKAFLGAISRGAKVRYEGRFKVSRNHYKWLSISADPISAKSKEKLYCGVMIDIDQTKRAEAALATMTERVSRAQEIANLGWYDYNVEKSTIDLTPGFATRLGFPHVPSGHLTGLDAMAYVETFRSAIHPDDRDRFASIIADTKWLQTEFDFRVITPGNEIRHLFIRIHRTTNERGKRIRDFAVILDITERKRLEEDLRAQASTDPLTGVANRRTFETSGRREVERARRYNKPFIIILIDIDHFKRVNDTYGHDIGDGVLKEVAKVCAAQLRGTDIFARYGGEEFIALLPETDLKAGAVLGERLRQGIALQPQFTPKGPLVVTASLGLSAFLANDKTLDEVVKRADKMLYLAKRSGRNRVEIFRPSGNARTAAE